MPAKELFDEIVGEGEAWFRRALQEGRSESRILDFKQATLLPPNTRERGARAEQAGDGVMRKDDRRNLADAISGFANSDGGVIVWGVECVQNGDDPDVVTALDPIHKVDRFFTDLQSATHEVVSGIIGVEHVVIRAAEDPGRGFVVTFVPQTEGAPVMAYGKDQNTYYYRAGSSFRRMEHWMVEDMFGRRPRPKLEPYLEGNWTLKDNGGNATFVFGVKNVGRGSARDVVLGFGIEPILELKKASIRAANGFIERGRNEDYPNRFVWDYEPGKSVLDDEKVVGCVYVGNMSDIVHPGMSLIITEGSLRVSNEINAGTVTARFHYNIYCEGFTLNGHKDVSLSDFVPR